MTTHALAFIALVIVAEHQVACGVAPNTAELQAWAFSLMERGFVSESVRAFHTIVDTFGTADPGVWHAWCNYAAAAIFKLDLESRFPGGLDAVLDICMQAERHDPGHPRTHQLRQGIQLELLLRELPPEARSMSPEVAATVAGPRSWHTLTMTSSTGHRAGGGRQGTRVARRP
ncbi:Glycosyltransferase 61 catalytic domain-containing protein [Plasmodiophora brassicae]